MFPWQKSIWQTLTMSQQNKHLGHGLLFHGAAGTGKNIFAMDFAHWLLCEQPLADKACGVCRSCQLIEAESQPDFLTLYPEESGKAIKVDQVRELIQKISLTSHRQGYRVIIISPADALNVNASNSLLKTLEEPPANTILIMITDKLSKLMPTIRSRAQLIRFDLPHEAQSLAWLNEHNIEKAGLLLKLSAGSPLAARSLAEDKGLELRDTLFSDWQALAAGQADALESAAMWVKEGFKLNSRLPLNWVSSWIMDIIRIKQGGSNENIVNSDYVETLQKMAGQVDLKAVYAFLDRLNDTVGLMATSANQLMLVEGLLLHWAGLKRI